MPTKKLQPNSSLVGNVKTTNGSSEAKDVKHVKKSRIMKSGGNGEGGKEDEIVTFKDGER